MTNNKQSSVEWLVEKLGKYNEEMIFLYQNEIQEAKAMHKEEKKQVLKDYFAWHKSKGFVSHKKEDIEEFINETFGGNNEQ